MGEDEDKQRSTPSSKAREERKRDPLVFQIATTNDKNSWVKKGKGGGVS